MKYTLSQPGTNILFLFACIAALATVYYSGSTVFVAAWAILSFFVALAYTTTSVIKAIMLLGFSDDFKMPEDFDRSKFENFNREIDAVLNAGSLFIFYVIVGNMFLVVTAIAVLVSNQMYALFVRKHVVDQS